MDINNLPKTAVRDSALYKALTKSHDAISSNFGGTDFRETEPVVTMPMVHLDRQPVDRVLGNTLFRRYLNGTLDVAGSVNVVVDALHRLKEGVTFLPEDYKALCCVFPNVPEVVMAAASCGIIPAIAQTAGQLGPHEVEMIRQGVAMHFMAEKEYAHFRGV